MATDASGRKKWDTEEYEKKAKEKDLQERERMQANESLVRQGKKPRLKPKENLPKPTQLLQQRDAPLELSRNLNQTMVVTNSGNRGPGQPGFFCDLCGRNYRDTNGYLDHINSRAHLRRMGQTTTIERSTLEQVRERIAQLRAQTKEKTTAKSFDFEKRLADVRAAEQQRREEKKRRKLEERVLAKPPTPEDGEMMTSMGFSGFGSTKRS